MLPGRPFLHENSNIGIRIFSGVFIMTVAGEYACLHLPVSTLQEIISSLMKALFECQMFSEGKTILWWFEHTLSSQPN